ncbi:hypothetical protein P1P68_19315 [Streptomyces scabiei]|uniref:hypothetical protein n=1 Tax=Streptomyces scabiei TaxID=1930 RepID=UPI00298F91EC|nr:hypothetical protein [Streptomyces scabiei]MDW8806872.1 hypothetical protein [Streptomyces scabiei]
MSVWTGIGPVPNAPGRSTAEVGVRRLPPGDVASAAVVFVTTAAVRPGPGSGTDDSAAATVALTVEALWAGPIR